MQSAFSIVKILVLEVSGFVLSEVSVQTEIVQNILFYIVAAYIQIPSKGFHVTCNCHIFAEIFSAAHGCRKITLAKSNELTTPPCYQHPCAFEFLSFS